MTRSQGTGAIGLETRGRHQWTAPESECSYGFQWAPAAARSEASHTTDAAIRRRFIAEHLPTGRRTVPSTGRPVYPTFGYKADPVGVAHLGDGHPKTAVQARAGQADC